MILVWLILIPFIGGLLSWLVARWNVTAARWIALAAMFLQLALAVGIWITNWGAIKLAGRGPWLIDYRQPWLPQLGISLHFGLDGFSLLLILLTGVIGVWSILASWRGIQERVGFFHFNLLLTLTGITGLFLALDLFLFYFFWEVMLVPLFFLIDIWGHERRHMAAVKFFIYTQAGGLFLLLGILGLYFVSGKGSFDYFDLLGTPMSAVMAMWLMFCFFLAFAVKLPAFPLHPWLPDAHTQAPVAGSVDLAGLVLKVAAYGMIRFMIPLFPAASLHFAPVAMTLAVIGILYGAILAFAQTDLKRLVAYTSISHMGFVLLGIFAWNELALQGALIIIIAHGISTGALFILVGMISDRFKSRSLENMGGLWPLLPSVGGVWMFFAMASLGLPGLGGFIGEFLVLLGTFKVSVGFAAVASLGFIVSVIYSLWMVQKVFFGRPSHTEPVPGLTWYEWAMMASAIIITLWLGLYPQPFMDTAAGSLLNLLKGTARVSSLRSPVLGTDIETPRLRLLLVAKYHSRLRLIGSFGVCPQNPIIDSGFILRPYFGDSYRNSLATQVGTQSETGATLSPEFRCQSPKYSPALMLCPSTDNPEKRDHTIASLPPSPRRERLGVRGSRGGRP